MTGYAENDAHMAFDEAPLQSLTPLPPRLQIEVNATAKSCHNLSVVGFVFEVNFGRFAGSEQLIPRELQQTIAMRFFRIVP
jgi:hypothetical protein